LDSCQPEAAAARSKNNPHHIFAIRMASKGLLKEMSAFWESEESDV